MSNLQKFSNSFEVNGEPLSDTIVSGNQNFANISCNAFIVVFRRMRFAFENFWPFRKVVYYDKKACSGIINT